MRDNAEIKYSEIDDTVEFEQIHRLILKAHSGNAEVDYNTTNVTEEEFYGKMSNGGAAFLAECSGTIVGVMMIAASTGKQWYLKGKIASLRFLVVHPDYAGRGIASMLMKKCVDWGEENGYQTLLWTTAYNNIPSIALSEKYGFRKTDYIKFRNIKHPSIRLVKWVNTDPPSKLKISVYYKIRKLYVSLRRK